MAKISVQETEISVIRINDNYISLTDMVRNLQNRDFFILNWLRNRNTIEFLGIWSGFILLILILLNSTGLS